MNLGYILHDMVKKGSATTYVIVGAISVYALSIALDNYAWNSAIKESKTTK